MANNKLRQKQIGTSHLSECSTILQNEFKKMDSSSNGCARRRSHVNSKIFAPYKNTPIF